MIRMRFRRIVNATNNLRPRPVCPKARYRFSTFECSGSGRPTNGSWKNTSSASSGVTRCISQFFAILASSQSNPVQAASGSFALISLYISYIYITAESGCAPVSAVSSHKSPISLLFPIFPSPHPQNWIHCTETIPRAHAYLQCRPQKTHAAANRLS